MQTTRRNAIFILVFSLALASLPAVAQVVTATLPAGTQSFAIGVDSQTNKAYVANISCPASPCNPGTVTVIDGATNNTASVNVGVYPYAVAVDSATNKIYVANYCGNDPTCNSLGTVTVIDGATNNTTTVTVAYYPHALAVDSVTNKIYVANYCGNDPTCSSPGTVTVIDANNNYGTSTVNVGEYPDGVAVNSVTNKIYVANSSCLNFPSCPGTGTVTVINGANNNSTQTVNVGVDPLFLALNSVTNKIYVSNDCGGDSNCASPGTVTVIDGATNITTTVNVGAYPQDIAVNSVTNQIYVANNCGNTSCSMPGTATVINANNNYSTTTVNVAFHPVFLDIETAANKIYVANTCGNDATCKSPGTVTVIDGTTNSTFPVAVGDEPDALAVNSSTNTIYVPNFLDNTVAVIGGATKLQFAPLTPCRLVDTRKSGGPIQGGTARSFTVPELGCNIPTGATAYSLNVTAVPQGTLGYLSIWPTPERQPTVSTLNSPDGRVKANAAIVQAGVSGAVSVYVSNTSNVVLDIDGYFAPSSQSTLQFYPLTPCRVADTRQSNFPQGLGAPPLEKGVPRDFPLLNATSCNIPSSAQAFSLNFTVVPYPQGSELGYLTVWPTGQNQPVVSTLNNPTGTVVANAAIVPAGTGGDIMAFGSDSTQLIIDINGYFAPPGQGGLSLYPMVPCRVVDTRQRNGAFMHELTVDVVDSACAPPNSAQAYAFNATVIPSGYLGYLTLWPDGEPQPNVSTLNAQDGAITSNMAIVPTNNGKIDAYASALTQLLLDISSYFAP